MKKLLQPLFLLSLQVMFSQSITTSQAINMMGKETMLTQRMGKDKIFLSHTPQQTVDSKKELVSSVIQFEKNLEILQGSTLTSEIQDDLLHLELLWIGYKENIDTQLKTNNNKVLDYNTILLNKCNSISKKLLESAKINKVYPYTQTPQLTRSTIASNSIKQLSQRLALYYSAYFYKEQKYNGADFKSIVTSIQKEISKIRVTENTNSQIKANTEDVVFQWKNIKAILTNVLNDDFISIHSSPDPSVLYKETNKLLYFSDLLSRTYKSTDDLK